MSWHWTLLRRQHSSIKHWLHYTTNAASYISNNAIPLVFNLHFCNRVSTKAKSTLLLRPLKQVFKTNLHHNYRYGYEYVLHPYVACDASRTLCVKNLGCARITNRATIVVLLQPLLTFLSARDRFSHYVLTNARFCHSPIYVPIRVMCFVRN